ncbi:fibronectin-like [Anneissia japonica]|uniref:fibronectin-like n=1 Tax=Anneissia japonica TaxID=1529436 RepID=UPI0014257C79|nr:fibronectin-like [Anneissia japonica]
MKRTIRNMMEVVFLMCLLYLCSAGVLPSPILEESTFQNATAIQVDWQFPSDNAVSMFVVTATGKFFDNATQELTVEGNIYSALLTELKSGETYIIAVVAVNITDNSTSRQKEVNTLPPNPEIEVVSSSLTSLSFNWSLPGGEIAKSFRADLHNEGILNYQQKEFDGNDVLEVTFHNLSSSTNYVLYLYTYGFNDLFNISQAYYSTDIPNILTSFYNVGKTYFTFKWWAEDLLFLSGPFLVEYYGQNIDTHLRNKTAEKTSRTADVTELISGETYIISVSLSTKVSTKTSNLTSVTTSLYAPTFIDRSQTLTSLTFTWSSINGFVEFYQLTYKGVEFETTPRTWNASGSEFGTTITGLTPGNEYEVKLVAVSNTQTSPADTLRISTMPGPVENLVVKFTNSSYLRADWDPPAVGYVLNYEVVIRNSTSILVTTDIYTDGFEYYDVVLEETYTVYVTSLAKDGERSARESASTGDITSATDIAHDANETTITITWTPPIDTYTLVRFICSSCSVKTIDVYATNLPVCIFTDLLPGSSHLISVETFLDGQSISTQILLFIQTIPDAPSISNTDDIGLDFIALSLTDTSCTSCTYRGQAISELGEMVGPVVYEPGSSETTFTMRFEALQPGTHYTINVVAEVNRLHSAPAMIEQKTNLAMATDITYKVNSSSVSLSWTPPLGLYDTVTLSCLSCGQTYIRTVNDTPQAIFSGFTSGSSYFFMIHTTRDGFQDTQQQILHIYTAPEPPEIAQIFSIESATITLYVHDQDCTSCDYMVSASSTALNDTVVTHDRTASESVFYIQLQDLKPGMDYFIQLVAINNGIESKPINFTATTKPLPPQNIRISQVTMFGFNVYWDSVEGNVDAYRIALEPLHVEVPDLNSLAQYYVFKNLQPFTHYNVTLYSLAGSEVSVGITETITTLQGIPGPVQDMKVTLAELQAIVIFYPPLQVFGVLEGYSVNQIGQFPGLPNDNNFKLTHVSDRSLIVFEDLLPGYNYTYVVSAKNADNFGDPFSASVIVPPNEPQPSEVKPELVPDSAITNSSFTVTINDLLFSEDNGPISTFVVIVAEKQAIGNSIGGETGHPQNAELPTWGQAINTNPTPRYQTSEPLNYSIVRNAGNRKRREVGVNINIGSEDCSSLPATTFCNGPLKPGKTYVYQFRGYYGSDYYADTLYSEPVTLNADEKTPVSEDSGIIVVAVVLGLVILVLIGLIIILVYSYRTKNKVLRTIVGRDGKFHEAKPAGPHMISLTSVKMKPEECWDVNFAQFESNIMQEQKSIVNISNHTDLLDENTVMSMQEEMEDNETSFTAKTSEETVEQSAS